MNGLGLPGSAALKITDDEFNYLVGYLKRNYGIDLSKKRVLLEGRLGNYLVHGGYKSYGEYIRALEQDKTGRELTNLLNKVTTNHTYFMRESDHFDYMRDQVLPIMDKTVRNRDLRVWCAASSTGEEPYTLAMILHDYFGSRTPAWDKVLLATDISQKVLDTASKGIYPIESTVKLPDNWKRRYFRKIAPDKVQIAPELRSQVVYRPFNLMDPIPFKKPFHIIFCRNVMIYFDAPTKAQVLERLYDALEPGGYLFIGHTESVSRPTRFKYIMPSVYQRGV